MQLYIFWEGRSSIQVKVYTAYLNIPILNIRKSLQMYEHGCQHLRNFFKGACWHPRIVSVDEPLASVRSFCKCCEVFKAHALAGFWDVSPHTCFSWSILLAQFGATSSVVVTMYPVM